MKLNVVGQPKKTTHEGAAAATHLTPEQKMRRLISTCLMWEPSFYESGQETANNMAMLVSQCDPDALFDMAVYARSKMNIRHAPLFVATEMLKYPKHKKLVGALLPQVIQRADEIGEVVAIYERDGKKPLPKQMKLGLAAAFPKFNAYQLGKYKNGRFPLKVVLDLVHPKPTTQEQAELWKALLEDTLPTPDTWETALSSGADKKATWTRLLLEKKLGGLALLRNLRNMTEVGVEPDIIRRAIAEMNTERILPFRFIAAYAFAPQFAKELEVAMFRCLEDATTLFGHTDIIVDVSGSMQGALSSKSDLSRENAAAALAILCLERCESCTVWTFSNAAVRLAEPARGFNLAVQIQDSQGHYGTNLGGALRRIQPKHRAIVITDEQSSDVIDVAPERGYIINVAAYANSIVPVSGWELISGFSERVFDFIADIEFV